MEKNVRTALVLGTLFMGMTLFAVASLLASPSNSLAASVAAQATGTAAPPAATSVPAGNVTLYASTVSNKLMSFNSGSPGTAASTQQITGLQSGENIVGIDFRPATGQLFGISSGSRLYTIDPATGAATVVGTAPLTTTLSGTEFGFDFNPVVDRIRLVSDSDQDLRLNPNNGTVAAIDGTLTYTTTDANTGKNPAISGSAYTNNFPGPASTVLYNIDTDLDILVTQNPPNSGTLNTVGPLGVNAGAVLGFDIVGANTAFAVFQLDAGAATLYTINLQTGAATSVGALSGGEAIRGLTGMLSAAPATVTPAPTATATFTPGPTSTPCPGGAVTSFTFTADSRQEVPTNNSTATASGSVTLDPSTGMITYNITVRGLVSETMAHFHRGAVGVNGPVIVPLPVGNTKTGTAMLPREEIANFQNGLFYFNAHTPTFPGGEIRGQVIGQCPGGSPHRSRSYRHWAAATSVPATSVPVNTTVPAPTATLEVFPTETLPVTAPPPAPTPFTPGMPTTGQGGGGNDAVLYLALLFAALSVLGIGLVARKRPSSTTR